MLLTLAISKSFGLYSVEMLWNLMYSKILETDLVLTKEVYQQVLFVFCWVFPGSVVWTVVSVVSSHQGRPQSHCCLPLFCTQQISHMIHALSTSTNFYICLLTDITQRWINSKVKTWTDNANYVGKPNNIVCNVQNENYQVATRNITTTKTELFSIYKTNEQKNQPYWLKVFTCIILF